MTRLFPDRAVKVIKGLCTRVLGIICPGAIMSLGLLVGMRNKVSFCPCPMRYGFKLENH